MFIDILMVLLGDIMLIILVYMLFLFIIVNVSNKDIIFFFIICVLLLYVFCLYFLYEDIDVLNVLIIFVLSKSYLIYFYVELL